MTDFLPVALTPSLDRQRYTSEFKRQIIEKSLTSGASIAAVVQAHGTSMPAYYINGAGVIAMGSKQMLPTLYFSGVQMVNPNPVSR